MQKAVTKTLALAAAGLLAGCGEVSFTGPSAVASARVPIVVPAPSGDAVTQTREVSGFDAVAISGVGTLLIEQAGAESLTISAEERVLPDLISEVRGGRLTLGTRPGAELSTSVPIVYRLGVRELSAIDVSGVVRVEASGLAGRELRVRLEGLTELRAAGTVDEQDAVVAGMSRYEAGDLESRAAELEVSGNGVARVRVRERLGGQVRDRGRVEYLGDPIVTIAVSGDGSVQHLGS